MHTRVMNTFLLLLSCYAVVASAGFSWGSLFFASDDDTAQEVVPRERDPKSQFELSTDQDRFIQAHGEYFDLPELDRCLHAAVEKLFSSCRDMPEEELGKLTVWLYNCHAQAEGRTTFLCTQAMTLAECTSPMSESAWGTYQTISNRARAFCYRMSQEHFAKKVELSVNTLTISASNQIQSMSDLQKITDSILAELNSRTAEFQLQQEEHSSNYQHLKSEHKEALSKVREKLSLDNDLYQQTFDRTLSFNRFVENMTQTVNISTLSQSLELAQLSKNIVQTHKQLLTFNTTLTRWFFQLADQINVQLSDMESEADTLARGMETLHSDLLDKNNQLVVISKQLLTTLQEASQESRRKVSHFRAVPDHLTLLFLAVVLSLLCEPSAVTKLCVLLFTSLASALYVSYSNPTYLSFAIILVPLLIFSERAYLWLFLRRKRSLVVDSQPLQPGYCGGTPVPNLTQEFAPFTTNFRDHPIFELNEPSSREVSPSGSTVSSASNSLGVKCNALTRSGLKCRRVAVGGERCRLHKPPGPELS